MIPSLVITILLSRNQNRQNKKSSKFSFPSVKCFASSFEGDVQYWFFFLLTIAIIIIIIFEKALKAYRITSNVGMKKRYYISMHTYYSYPWGWQYFMGHSVNKKNRSLPKSAYLEPVYKCFNNSFVSVTFWGKF